MRFTKLGTMEPEQQPQTWTWESSWLSAGSPVSSPLSPPQLLSLPLSFPSFPFVSSLGAGTLSRSGTPQRLGAVEQELLGWQPTSCPSGFLQSRSSPTLSLNAVPQRQL